MDVVTLALAKKYADSHSGGGVSKVNSVNGKIGDVVLKASDVGAGAVEAVHCDIGSVRVGEIEDATLGKHSHIMGFTSSSNSDPVLRYINYKDNGKSSSERLLLTYESSTDDFIVNGDANGKSKTFKLSEYAKNEEISQKEREITDLKMLGWTVPSECPIQNYTDANGIFHQRVGRVDLGSLAWGYLTSPVPYFGTDLSNIKINTNNMYCKSYPITKSTIGIANMPDKTLKSDGGSYAKVYVKDSAYTDVTTFKTAMSGTYLYYELATEVTKSVDGNECTSSDVKTLTIPTDNFNLYLVKQGNLKQIRVYEATQKTFAAANWVELGTYPEFACADNGVSMYVQIPLLDIVGKQFAAIQFNKSGLIRLRLSAITNGWLQTSATYL